MKIAIVANASRANYKMLSRENLDELASKFNLDYEIYFENPNQIQSLLESLSAQSYSCFLIAGGDGTVRMAAQVLVNQNVPLVILPLGTFNYFARELQYPNDIEETFKIIKNNKTKMVDVAEVNGITFINHTVIGFYSYVLKLKQKYKGILKNYKFLKVIFTALNILKVIPIYTLTLKMDEKECSYKTSLLFVGNNYHFTNFWDFGTRQTLSGGMLAVYIFHCHTRWQIIKCMLAMLFNTENKDKYLEEFLTKELVVSAESKQISVDIDGDLKRLPSPLTYLMHKKQLKVLVP